jgi:hypothetical protein
MRGLTPSAGKRIPPSPGDTGGAEGARVSGRMIPSVAKVPSTPNGARCVSAGSDAEAPEASEPTETQIPDLRSSVGREYGPPVFAFATVSEGVGCFRPVCEGPSSAGLR